MNILHNILSTSYHKWKKRNFQKRKDSLKFQVIYLHTYIINNVGKIISAEIKMLDIIARGVDV